MKELYYKASSGRQIAYYFIKGIAPLIIIFHGWAHSKERWLSFINSHLKDYTVLVLDLPGFGNSQSKISAHTLSEYCVDIKDFLDYLGINSKDAIAIAHSFGGCVCLELLKEIAFSKIVLLNTPLKPVWCALLIKSLGKIANTFFQLGLRNKFLLYIVCRLTVSKFKFIDDLMINDAKKMTASNAVITLKLLSKINYCQSIETNNLHLLIIFGKKDNLISLHQYDFFRLYGELLIIPTVGHTPFLEAEMITGKAIANFIQKS